MEKEQKNYIPLPAAIILAGVMISVAVFFNGKISASRISLGTDTAADPISTAEAGIIPLEGVELPVVWGDLGQKLVSVGAIDKDRFLALYQDRGQSDAKLDQLLNGFSVDKLKINRENAGYILNLLWALGLSSKNEILENGEMSDPTYGGAGRFASTGGWTLSQGSPMEHYSRHRFFNLTPEKQALVDKVSRNIYRPCCNNSTHFPDCNHGMAMLGFIELMASQNISETEMYKAALALNSYWFPETYLTIRTYMQTKGMDWNNVEPQIILGREYSSASGYGRVSKEVSVIGEDVGGNGCSVKKNFQQNGGCGI